MYGVLSSVFLRNCSNAGMCTEFVSKVMFFRYRESHITLSKYHTLLFVRQTIKPLKSETSRKIVFGARKEEIHLLDYIQKQIIRILH